jgi:hypothetical protein
MTWPTVGAFYVLLNLYGWALCRAAARNPR